MKKIIIALAIALPLAFAALFLFVLYEAPRMTVQHHIRDFQMIMPAPAAGTVPVTLPERLPTASEAAKLKNPLQPTPQNYAAARVYYTYYCVFCHGDYGDGNGPVGQSYVPRPADLRSERVARYGDGELLLAMMTGIGHEPVLERVVPPEHRWYLVSYVRSLAPAGK